MSDTKMKAKFKQWYLTKAPKQFKEMFAKTTEEEGIMLEVCFHQFAEMVANGANASDSGLHLQRVSNNEERVAVSCSSCKWMQAKYDYKCDGCTQFQNYEQDTDC